MKLFDLFWRSLEGKCQSSKFRSPNSDLWTDAKVMRAVREEKESEEKESKEKGSVERRSRCGKRQKNREALCFPNVLWLRRVEK